MFHHSLNHAIRVEGSGHTLEHNLITLVYWSATLQPSSQNLDFNYPGAIDLTKADSSVVKNNLIAGVERIGFKYNGEDCQSSSWTISGNVIYGASTGVAVLRGPNTQCLKVSSFLVFKSAHYAVYYQGESTLMVDNNILVENQIGVYAILIGNSALTHKVTSMEYTVSNSLFVGQTSTYDCAHDVKPNGISEQRSKMDSFGAGADGSGKIAIAWPAFVSKWNDAPIYWW